MDQFLGSRPLICLIFLSLICIIGIYLWKSVQATNVKNRGTRVSYVRLLLSSCDTVYDHLPSCTYRDSSGRVLGSWRFSSLVFEDFGDHPFNVNVAWNNPDNQWFASLRNEAYCLANRDGPERFDTNILAVTGSGTAFDKQKVHRLSELPPNLILLVEVAHSHVHWMEDGDLDIEHIPETVTRGIDDKGFHVSFVDGSTWFLSREVPLSDLKKFFTIEIAKRSCREGLLGPYHVREYDK